MVTTGNGDNIQNITMLSPLGQRKMGTTDCNPPKFQLIPMKQLSLPGTFEFCRTKRVEKVTN